MTVRLVVALVLLLVVVACGMASTFAAWRIVEEVNPRLPENEKFDPVGWTFPKQLRLFREYRRLYPSGRLVSRFWFLVTAMFTSLLGIAWLVGFFR
jgi:hypothetical protein